MISSLSQTGEVIAAARAAAGTADGLTPSPEDWRQHMIYFLMVDRFNRPDAPPRHQPWDDPGGPLLACGVTVRPIEVVVLALSG